MRRARSSYYDYYDRPYSRYPYRGYDNCCYDYGYRDYGYYGCCNYFYPTDRYRNWY